MTHVLQLPSLTVRSYTDSAIYYRTRLLHRLPPSFGVRFDGPSLETVKDLIVNWPVVSDCVLRPHDHDLDHEVGPCLNAAAHVGTALFATGIACLAEAKTSILGLNISCAMDKDFGWDRLPAWKQLDLSGLYGFVFNPYLQIRYQEINVRDEYFPIAHNASAAVDMVLEKSRKSLEDFEYGPNCPQHWPGPDVISLPELRHLELHGGWLRPTNLKDWIASMPVLENIALVCIMQDEEDSVTGWRHVLDAIRNHENGIQIEFDYLEQESELSREWILNDSPPLDFHTSDPSRYRAMKVEPGSWLEFKRSLALYLSGEGDFDQVLIDGFKKDG